MTLCDWCADVQIIIFRLRCNVWWIHNCNLIFLWGCIHMEDEHKFQWCIDFPSHSCSFCEHAHVQRLNIRCTAQVTAQSFFELQCKNLEGEWLKFCTSTIPFFFHPISFAMLYFWCEDSQSTKKVAHAWQEVIWNGIQVVRRNPSAAANQTMTFVALPDLTILLFLTCFCGQEGMESIPIATSTNFILSSL